MGARTKAVEQGIDLDRELGCCHPLKVTGLASIIVNYRSSSFVERLLASRALAGTTVTIVDNGSEPDEVTALAASYGATAILLETNIGFAAAVNVAVAQLPPDCREVLLVNPDVRMAPDAVTRLDRALHELAADAVSPVILVEGTDRVQGGNGGGPLSIGSLLNYYWFVAHLFPRCRGIFLTRVQTRGLSTACELEWLCMACLLVRRDAFARFGPVPEDEVVYSEDIAWGTKASATGAHLFLVPSVTIEHRRGGSGGSSYQAYMGSLTRLLDRRLSRRRAAVARFIVRSGLLVRRAVGRKIG